MAALAWGTCANCTQLVSPASAGPHSCCPDQQTRPAAKPCQTVQADVAKAGQPLEVQLAPVADAVTSAAAEPVLAGSAGAAVVAATVQFSPPPLHLLFAVFLI